MKHDEHRDYLTINDIINDLGVDKMTVRRWIRDGELKGEKISNRQGYQIDPDSYEAFLDEHSKYAAIHDELMREISRTKKVICEEIVRKLMEEHQIFMETAHLDNRPDYISGWNNAMLAASKIVKNVGGIR